MLEQYAAFHDMKPGLSDDQVELLPDASTFNFANGQQALAREVQDMVSYKPPLFTDFSVIDEGKVPLKNLGVSLDLGGTPERIIFHQGLLKGHGVPLHRNRASRLTLNVRDSCEKAKASAHKGRQLHCCQQLPSSSQCA